MINPNDPNVRVSKFFVPGWLMDWIAPKITSELHSRSALTGQASKQVSEMRLFWGLLTIEVIVVEQRSD